jgi:hypothetical protein
MQSEVTCNSVSLAVGHKWFGNQGRVRVVFFPIWQVEVQMKFSYKERHMLRSKKTKTSGLSVGLYLGNVIYTRTVCAPLSALSVGRFNIVLEFGLASGFNNFFSWPSTY